MEAIKNLMAGASKAALVIPASPTEEEFLLEEILREALEKTGKKVYVSKGDTEKYKNNWRDFIKSPVSQFPEKIYIRFPGKIEFEGISQTNEALLTFAPDAPMPLENIQIQKGLAVPDALIAFVENKDALSSRNLEITLPEESKMIFLGSKTRTLSEKIFDLVKLISPEVAGSKSTMLYGALAIETKQFSKNLSAGVFGLAKTLLEAGAKPDSISGRLNKTENLSAGEIQLLGRALARSMDDQALKIFWTFLAATDFEKTHIGSSEEKIISLQQRIAKYSPKDCVMLILWENSDRKVFGLAAGEGERLILLANSLGAALKNNNLFFGPYENFSSAEKALRDIFKGKSQAEISRNLSGNSLSAFEIKTGEANTHKPTDLI